MTARTRTAASIAVLLVCGSILGGCSLLTGGATPAPPTDVPPAGLAQSSPVATQETEVIPPTATTASEAVAPVPGEDFSPGSVVLEQTLNTEQSTGGIDWSFDAPKDLVIRVDVVILGGSPSYELRLIDPFNNQIAHLQAEVGQQQAAIPEIMLPYEGNYQVEFLPVSGTGTATVTVTALDAPSGGESLEIGESVTAALDVANAYHTYSFLLNEGDVVSVSAIAESNGLPDTQFDLYGPDGRLMAETDDVDGPENQNAVLTHFVAPLTGNYVAIVTNRGKSTGSYEFSVQSDTVPPIAEGDPDLQLGHDYRIQLFEGSNLSLTFDGVIGDVIKVETLGLGTNLEIDMRLVSPFGQVIAYALDASAGQPENLNEVQLPYDGRYTLEIVPSGQGETTLRLINLGQDGLTGGGVFGDELSGSRPGRINASNVFHYYQFNGRAGDRVTLSVLSDSLVGNLDLGMALLAPDGYQAAFADNQDSVGSLDPLLDAYRLTETGTYTVVVYTFDPEARGTYELSFVREEN